jgi:hypothetical protein
MATDGIYYRREMRCFCLVLMRLMVRRHEMVKIDGHFTRTKRLHTRRLKVGASAKLQCQQRHSCLDSFFIIYYAMPY